MGNFFFFVKRIPLDFFETLEGIKGDLKNEKEFVFLARDLQVGKLKKKFS